MNTPQTMLLGWGTLIAAATVSYYYAKKGIDERRRKQDLTGTRPSEKLDWRSRVAKEENAATSTALAAARDGGTSGGSSVNAAPVTSNTTSRGAS